MSAIPAREWSVVLGALVLGTGLFFWRGSSLGGDGKISARITLLTSDREDLDCGLDAPIQGLSCAYDRGGKPVLPPPSASARLAPYLTVERRLLLLPGLFEEPELAERYEKENPRLRARPRLRRFTVSCELELLTKVSDVNVRWTRASAWGNGGTAWVARPRNCRVESEPNRKP